MLPDVSGITCGHSGVFRRASKWMRNNCAVHCGILIVYCWNVLFYFYVALLAIGPLITSLHSQTVTDCVCQGSSIKTVS